MEDIQDDTSTSPSLVSSLSSSSPEPHSLPLDAELWLMVEERTQEILNTIQPIQVSEENRMEVFEYVRKLINNNFGIEVFLFGSVPLKTYLPDGDIDLTAVCPKNMEENIAREVFNALEDEAQDPNSQVKDVRFIEAQVKIIKCRVQGILVDISFNQMAGLSALCFLEQVDQLFGKNHLLKQSIILIKAWCFYESRIHGAHYGLLSTYALEMLVLYIINRFHSSLCGPLAVLYKFLDYYRTFDWANYCLTINGPVTLSSLRQRRGEVAEDGEEELFLTQEFLRQCKEVYSTPIKALEHRKYDFPIKFYNIVDPLKENNNIGRSVSRGNCCRIRSTMNLSFRKLNRALMQSAESLGVGLEQFFQSTLVKNGRGIREDVKAPVPIFGTGRYELPNLIGDYATNYNGLLYGQWFHNYTLPVPTQFSLSPPPSEEHTSSPWEIVRQLFWDNRDYFLQFGNEITLPGMSFSCPYITQLPSNIITSEGERPRGTGTYIPDMTNISYQSRYELFRIRNREFTYRDEATRWRNRDYTTRDEAGRMRNRDRITRGEQGKIRIQDITTQDEPSRVTNRESTSQVMSPKSQGETAEVEDLLATDNVENECSLDLSLDSFPLLPVMKNASLSESGDQFDSSAVRSTESPDCYSPMANLKFWKFQMPNESRDFSSPMASLKFGRFPIANKLGASSTSNSVPGSPNIGKQNREGLSETGEQKLAVKSYHLKDADDFPPLSS